MTILPRRLSAIIGPGLLWAAAAIGVSHLVQSTRAGAMTGFGLVGVIILALVLKYPFFEFGPRYAASTGTTLVEGYRRIGRWALWLFLAITLLTAFISLAAVALFTTYLLLYALGLGWPLWVGSAVIMVACGALLIVGRYQALDVAIKALLVLLTLSTLTAAFLALPQADFSTLRVLPAGVIGGVVPFAFLLALVGWMPSPVDTSVWNSLWVLAKSDATGVRATVAEARFDFNLGYFGTAVMAIAFVVLGAGVMYGSGTEFSAQGMVFATELVDLYGETLGTWARPVVLVAVITTMFSTTLTILDGFPRAIERTLVHLKAGDEQPDLSRSGGPFYWMSLVALGVSTVVVSALFVGDIASMIDFATIVSFLTAPALGYLNLRAISSDPVPAEHRPGKAMRALSWVGLTLLGGTGVVYVISLVS